MREFPNPKINRPKMNLTKETDKKTLTAFEAVENYSEMVSPYIFTDIDISFDRNDERFYLSRIQHILSSTLLRSLYLRNGIIDAINSKNMISLFANLKSFMEVPALLMYLHSVIDSNDPHEKQLDKFLNIVFGNRGEGEFRVGKREAISVLTMFSKLDKFLKKTAKKSNKNLETSNTMMTDFYDIVCNVAHPNHDAHDITGEFNCKKGIWRGLEPKEYKSKLIVDAAWYTPPLNMTIIMTKTTCKLIMNHSKVKNFNKLSNQQYFQTT